MNSPALCLAPASAAGVMVAAGVAVPFGLGFAGSWSAPTLRIGHSAVSWADMAETDGEDDRVERPGHGRVERPCLWHRRCLVSSWHWRGHPGVGVRRPRARRRRRPLLCLKQLGSRRCWVRPPVRGRLRLRHGLLARMHSELGSALVGFDGALGASCRRRLLTLWRGCAPGRDLRGRLCFVGRRWPARWAGLRGLGLAFGHGLMRCRASVWGNGPRGM